MAAAAPAAVLPRVVNVRHLDAPRVSEPTPVLERTLALSGEHMHWLVLAWGLGVTVSSMRLLSGWLKLRRLVREAEPAPAEWQEALEHLSRRLGMTRPVRLLRSAALDVPAAVGWLRPVVLLPVTALTGLSARQLEMVLAHELAHIRRHDFVVNLVQTLVETLLFYHPAVWWMSRVIRVEREHCCDDIAVGTSGNPVSYARRPHRAGVPARAAPRDGEPGDVRPGRLAHGSRPPAGGCPRGALLLAVGGGCLARHADERRGGGGAPGGPRPPRASRGLRRGSPAPGAPERPDGGRAPGPRRTSLRLRKRTCPRRPGSRGRGSPPSPGRCPWALRCSPRRSRRPPPPRSR